MVHPLQKNQIFLQVRRIYVQCSQANEPSRIKLENNTIRFLKLERFTNHFIFRGSNYPGQ